MRLTADIRRYKMGKLSRKEYIGLADLWIRLAEEHPRHRTLLGRLDYDLQAFCTEFGDNFSSDKWTAYIQGKLKAAVQAMHSGTR